MKRAGAGIGELWEGNRLEFQRPPALFAIKLPDTPAKANKSGDIHSQPIL